MTPRSARVKRPQASDDPRELPAYGISTASHYLRIPIGTLRGWAEGYSYRVRQGSKAMRSRPLFDLPRTGSLTLSFYNLAEAHVLNAFRKDHKIPMHRIRTALDYVGKRFGWRRPLIEQRFQTDGVNLLIDHLGELIDASHGGQKVLRGLVAEYLQRLEWEGQFVIRLYPFTRMAIHNSPKMVLIDPRFAFGRPILKASRVETSIVAERYKAGDSIQHLSRDYGCSSEEIEEAIRCELNISVAA